MTELVLVSAESEAALVAEMGRLISFIDRVPEVSLADIAYTCSLTRGECVAAVIAPDTASFRSKLVLAKGRIEGGCARIKDRGGLYYTRNRLIGPGGGKLAFLHVVGEDAGELWHREVAKQFVVVHSYDGQLSGHVYFSLPGSFKDVGGPKVVHGHDGSRLGQ